ncbi:MAG TPA: hypothetical protein PLB88_10370 [Thermoanaerobaculaceae bacterium]|nr:hypothetical protein [Thermoanaerobaculaceae bacterium]
MTLPPDMLGDRGQRYEVRYREPTDPVDQHKVLGWSDDRERAERMAAGWRKHPERYHVWVADRGERWASDTQEGGQAT